MTIIAKYANTDHTSVVIISGYTDAPCIGENGNPYNLTGQEIWDAAHDGMTPEDFIAPPNPAKKLTRIEILDKLSDAELQTAYTALNDQNDFKTKIYWDAATIIYSDDERVIGMLTALFGSTRASQILGE